MKDEILKIIDESLLDFESRGLYSYPLVEKCFNKIKKVIQDE